MAKYAFIGVALILGAVLVGNMGGCGGVQDRVGVVADKALKEIDKLIGSLDVQRKTVERKLNDVQVATRSVGEQHVRFEVKHKRAVAEQEKLAATKAGVRSNLKKLQALLAEANESGSVKVAGTDREVTTAQLDTMAKEQLEQLKLIETKTKQSETTTKLLKQNLDMLGKQKSTSEKQLTKLASMIEKIDGQIEILKAQRTAESIVSPSKDINTGFDELEASVNKLSEDLEVQIAVTDEKLEARLRELDGELASPTDIDMILQDKDDVSTTLSDIDKALNGE